MSPVNFSDLQAFAAVARLSSFRGAAAELGVTPSALSHTIRGLETSLGVRLLNRTTRSVSMTAAGEHFLGRLAPALEAVRGAIDEVNTFRDSPVGSLRINAPRVAAEHLLAPLVTRFLQAYPGMKVELVADDRFVDIVSEGFDAGVRFGESLQQGMVALPLGPQQRFVVVAAPAYLAAHGEPVNPHELQQHRCICMRFPSGALYRWEFSRGGETLAVEVAGALTVGEMPLIVHAAKNGLGLGYVYEQYAAPEIQAGRLRTVLDDWCPPVDGFYFYYPSRRQMSAGMKAFIALIRQTRQEPQPAR